MGDRTRLVHASCHREYLAHLRRNPAQPTRAAPAACLSRHTGKLVRPVLRGAGRREALCLPDVRVRKRRRGWRKVRVGAPDPALTPVAGMVAISELVDRLGLIEALDAAVGPSKQRDRGFGAGELLVGLAAAQLAGEDFLVGLDRQRTDVVGQVIAPVPGLCSTTAAGLAR